MTLSYAALAEENAQLHSVVTGQSSEISRQRQRIEQLEAMLKDVDAQMPIINPNYKPKGAKEPQPREKVAPEIKDLLK